MRAWGLSLAVAVVSASTFAAGLHQGESLDVDCTRTSPEATRCLVTSRRGLWAFVEVSTREVLLSNEISVEWSEHSSRSGSYETLSAVAPGERDRLLNDDHFSPPATIRIPHPF